VNGWLGRAFSPRGRLLLGAGAIVLAAGLGLAAYRTYHHLQHDPSACFTCHVHDEAQKVWAKTEHANIDCHECHKASTQDQAKQVFRFAFLGPRTVPKRHGEIIVSRTLCLGCHWDRRAAYPKAPDISVSRFHAKHVFQERIECTKCHGYRTHKFTMEERHCLACHKERAFSTHGAGAKPDAHVPMSDLPCMNCHTDHTRDLRPNRMKCLYCHGGQDVRSQLARDTTIDARHFRPSDEAVSRAKKIVIAESAAMKFDCSTCHSPHEKARADWSNCAVPCHRNTPASKQHEVHRAEGLACKDCHKPHLWKVSAEQAKKICTDCHDYKEPMSFLR
jgi:hypothetical protein